MENSNVKLPEGIIILPYGNNMAIIEHGNKMFFWTVTLFVFFFGLCSQGFIVDPADTVNQTELGVARWYHMADSGRSTDWRKFRSVKIISKHNMRMGQNPGT